jgi:2-polyprenyl-3-methyl-5-hydroxy-6-metoxy-1,4-benzoquinol methylase
MEKIVRDIKKLLRRTLGRETREKPPIQFASFEAGIGHPFLSNLSDADLMELNGLLPWNAFVADAQGRRFGNLAWKGKRVTPQEIPDPRHKLLSERISLNDLKVLEIGCFEGIHTVSLCHLAKEVIAIDSRVENVVKTMVRCGFFGVKPTVFRCDVEDWDVPHDWLKADVCHHVGVLYHLKDPVAHLNTLCGLISTAVFLDTHVALPTDTLLKYTSEEKIYGYKNYGEGGKRDVFSGMHDHSKWLLLNDIRAIFASRGFTTFEVLEQRAERNGPRVLVFARR